MAKLIKRKLDKKQKARLAEIRKLRESGKDNYGNPKKSFYDGLAKMGDEELFRQTKQSIWLSAYANNNPRSDYHWQADACLDIWDDRSKVEQYQKAFDEVLRETCG